MRRLKKFLIVILSLVVIFSILNIIPPSKVIEVNPFIVEHGELPMLVAHRGGKYANPENTLKAYKYAISDAVKADVLETDLWLTKDGHLVLNHDSTINRTSDVVEVTGQNKKHYISDYTLAELENFNYGAKFEKTENVFPYKDLVTVDQIDRKEVIKANEVGITTFEQFLNTFLMVCYLFFQYIYEKNNL